MSENNIRKVLEKGVEEVITGGIECIAVMLVPALLLFGDKH